MLMDFSKRKNTPVLELITRRSGVQIPLPPPRRKASEDVRSPQAGLLHRSEAFLLFPAQTLRWFAPGALMIPPFSHVKRRFFVVLLHKSRVLPQKFDPNLTPTKQAFETIRQNPKVKNRDAHRSIPVTFLCRLTNNALFQNDVLCRSGFV